jgi:hypothetical protein
MQLRYRRNFDIEAFGSFNIEVLNYNIEVLDFDIEETSILKYFEVLLYQSILRYRGWQGHGSRWMVILEGFKFASSM